MHYIVVTDSQTYGAVQVQYCMYYCKPRSFLEQQEHTI